jgi:hypothetical protein
LSRIVIGFATSFDHWNARHVIGRLRLGNIQVDDCLEVQWLRVTTNGCGIIDWAREHVLNLVEHISWDLFAYGAWARAYFFITADSKLGDALQMEAVAAW